MLIRVHGGKPFSPRYKSHVNGDLENMTITYYPELALFLQSIDSNGMFTATYAPPDGGSKSLDIQLEPEVAHLEEIDVRLHQSPTKAYKMPERVNAWFSECLGYDVMLVYLGPNRRPVLGNLSPNAAQNGDAASKSWLSSLTATIPSLTASKHVEEEEGISFADVAAYLVITEESLRDVDSRLQDGTQMDVTKFRPNIVLSGAEAAYEEDYWGSITINPNQTKGTTQTTEIVLTQNCGRCVSINVDYSTGKPGTGEANVLKKLMKDRRVDKGNKYSPIFGRYGFLKGGVAGELIAVGDEVTVSRTNKERTTFRGSSICGQLKAKLT